MQRMAFRRPQSRGIIAEGILRLRDDHRQLVPAIVLDVLQILERLCPVFHTVCAIDLARDGFDGSLDSLLRIVKLLGSALQVFQQGLCQLGSALAALGPHIGFLQGHSEVFGPLPHELAFCFGIGPKEVERYYRLDPELAQVFYVSL